MKEEAAEHSSAHPTAESVADLLSEHGYPFQYSVLGRIMTRFRPNGGSPWIFAASELPVSANDVDARIDFVLKHHSDTRYVVAECKRANPAYANWCFFQAPYVLHPYNGVPNLVRVQRWIHQPAMHNPSFAVIAGELDAAYQIALPLKRRVKGDGGGQPKKDIDDALTQVARGVTGLVTLFNRTPTAVGDRGVADIFAVLFTTANLFVSDVHIGRAPLTTGIVDAAELRIREAPWVAYQYHASVSVQYSAYSPTRPTSLGQLLTDDAMRTIFVVHAGAVDDFLIKLDSFRVPQ